MYVYTTINTQIFVCIQTYYHSCKSYLNTHIIVCKNVFYKELCVNMLVQILIICNVKVNVSPLKSTTLLLSSSK